MTPDRDYDASDLLCPLPVLRAQKLLAGMKPGQILRIVATDGMARIDMPHFCDQAGHEFLGSEDLTVGTAYLIRKRQAAPAF